MAMPVPPSKLDNETIDRLNEAAAEISQMQREIDVLRPQAEAYQTMRQILGMFPARTGHGMREDPVHRIRRFIVSRIDPDAQKLQQGAGSDQVDELDNLMKTMGHHYGTVSTSDR